MTDPAKTIDMTPTWQGILPYLLLGIESGDQQGHKAAREELVRMAQAADLWNEHVTKEKAKHDPA